MGELQAWIDGVESEVHEVARTGDTNATQHVGALVRDSFQRIEDASRRGSATVGLSTGFERLDALTGGMQPGQFWIVAGRPGMGKTSLAMNIAVNAAWPVDGVAKVGVGVFSLEMPAHEVSTRLVCSEARVDLGKLRNASLQPDDWSRLTEAAQGVSSLPLWVDDTPGLSPMALRSKARRLRSECDRRKVKLGVIVVDHIGLMRGGLGPKASREQEVSECSRSLKELAKELQCTVIGLSQLNRQVEMRAKDKRPQLSDMRDSGSLEQDCDTAVFMYRDEYYHPDSKTPGIAEAAVLKQRNGPTGKVLLRWQGAYTRFETLAPADYPQHWTETGES